MLLTIQRDPAIFHMDLKTQMEDLVLQHLRSTHRGGDSFRWRGVPLVIIIDGVDECGMDQYDDPNRSREKDQIEVLTTLLDAVLDPSFPCKVIVASRPESWIRRFFAESAAGHLTEIFLDDKFSPDKDIEFFLKSKFAELSRRYNFTPSTWPKDEDIGTLKQLDIVLSIAPPKDGDNPFAILDALYTAVLNFSPNPSETVLWLKAHERLRYQPAVAASDVTKYLPSAWTIDRLFESTEGQAQLLLDLPSLVFIGSKTHVDSYLWGKGFEVPVSRVPNRGWESTYSFYHKSFLDFLASPQRSGVVFPDVNDERVIEWIWERFHLVWKLAGPEVPIDEVLLATFRSCFTYILSDELRRARYGPPMLKQGLLSKCDPAVWYTGQSALRSLEREYFLHNMLVLVHSQCRFHRPCLAGCKRWRKALLRLPDGIWYRDRLGSLDVMLDRFCIKRIYYKFDWRRRIGQR
ncbi:hypothetical protein NMY22_g15084 [Coprinellus aureogranulatus]|nr:hypothetical protein NMY22_g15084 [Coprinellus aureogranulatus]